MDENGRWDCHEELYLERLETFMNGTHHHSTLIATLIFHGVGVVLVVSPFYFGIKVEHLHTSIHIVTSIQLQVLGSFLLLLFRRLAARYRLGVNTNPEF